ncbi:hypothetical protein OH146_12205 [Salinibacterium sp. SYSU T00001]|uniref:hypothetical protein n=1 Tax=Homoserinimonas sedimenticola TaxID=2986805 RepID=UPI0022368DC8|nr:hypothetical protein [Salinibacterium sedimenticola]MCW4386536.1 hypothetical protein [Salinibacterium sedimenticola]
MDDVAGLLLLDVDGVINRLDSSTNSSTLPTVLGSSGRPLPINLIEEAVLEIIDDVARRPDIRLGWLTTWGFRVARLETVLDGRLSGGFVVAERPYGPFVPSEWKLHAAVKLFSQFPEAEFAWADDDAIPVAMRYNSVTHRLPGALLLAPAAETGLTSNDAKRIVAHFAHIVSEIGSADSDSINDRAETTP